MIIFKVAKELLNAGYLFGYYETVNLQTRIHFISWQDWRMRRSNLRNRSAFLCGKMMCLVAEK